MAIENKQKSDISDLLKEKILNKLKSYNPETSNMPFHTRLLGKDRMALFSFIQSINTMLGTSVFEQISEIIAKPCFKKTIHQFKGFNNTISSNAQLVIQEIMDDLSTGRCKSNKDREIERILSCSDSGEIKTVKKPRIDLFIETFEGEELYFDLKTAKPNIKDFLIYKRTLLEWIAIRGALNNKAKINTLLAIPYNPYEPEPYQRWTLQGLFDLEREVLVAEDYWDFIGKEGTYEQLLGIFEETGIELRDEIDKYFLGFR